MKKYVVILSLAVWVSSSCSSSEKKDKSMESKNMELATFGGGCFWCTEAIFERVDGVLGATSGYSGGEKENPTYDEVCSGATGHAEVVQIEFDPDKVSYLELLEIFIKTHDPTTLNQQGMDRGSQYRSVVLYHNQKQRDEALDIIKELSAAKIWKDPIVTQVEEFEKFYSAEAYHQEYFENNSKQMYCQMVIVPKIEKFEKLFSNRMKQK
ncbi:MAG: peptide-methionine (S)-S-oxide reductase MsrA [Salinivirgaceae bacterium]|nr:peptide-methionine (S)-S-oxide reductase MsrA [Salinivirgaceae bacterium]